MKLPRRRFLYLAAGAAAISRIARAQTYPTQPVRIVVKVRELKAQGIGASEIAKALKIGRASVYRALGERTQ
jgi:DNA invertase Pin-like site-specific DNA recombinase